MKRVGSSNTMLNICVLYLGIGFCAAHGAFSADGAVHVAGEPVFGEDAGLLGGAFVALYQGRVEFQIHVMCQRFGGEGNADSFRF